MPSEKKKTCNAQDLAPRRAAGRPARHRSHPRSRLLHRRATPLRPVHPPTRADRPRPTRSSRTLQMTLERLVRDLPSLPARRLHHLREPLGRARAWPRTSPPRRALSQPMTRSASRRRPNYGSACSTAPRRQRGSWSWCCLAAGNPRVGLLTSRLQR